MQLAFLEVCQIKSPFNSPKTSKKHAKMILVTVQVRWVDTVRKAAIGRLIADASECQ